MAADVSGNGAVAKLASTNGKRPRPPADRAETDVLSDAQREHQIKTELAIIYGFSTTLDQHWDQLSDAERRHGVATIGRRTEALMEQTERLLQDAKRDVAGRARPVARVDVAELVRVAAAGWNQASDAPTPPACSRCWAISSTTPSSTPPARGRCRSASRRPARGSPST